MLIGLRTCHRGHFVHPSFGILETNIYMRVCDDSVLQGGGEFCELRAKEILFRIFSELFE